MGALLLLLVMFGIAGLVIFWSKSNEEQNVAQEEAAQQLEGAPVLPDPALREQRMATLFQGALADTNNGDDFRESSGYTNLLRELQPYTPEEVAAKSTRWLNYDSAMKDPDGWRGEFIRDRGLVAGFRAERLQTPVLGVKDVWRGFLCQGDQSEKIVFDLLTQPPSDARPNYDAWDIEGVFYRTVKFEDSMGRVQEMPYIIGKAIHPAQAPSRLGIMKYPVIVLMAVVGLALFLARLLLLLAKTRRPAPRGASDQIRRLMTLQQARKTSPPTPPPSS
ncbi:MAG: hypothetical protein IPJ19_00175 [Planctomycetes bacterium]|nr:hypothetical protein [Planctomycetota bacterium]